MMYVELFYKIVVKIAGVELRMKSGCGKSACELKTGEGLCKMKVCELKLVNKTWP